MLFRSASVDLYHNFGRVQANLLVEGFYTMLEDVFTLEKIGEDAQGNRWWRDEESGQEFNEASLMYAWQVLGPAPDDLPAFNREALRLLGA